MKDLTEFQMIRKAQKYPKSQSYILAAIDGWHLGGDLFLEIEIMLLIYYYLSSHLLSGLI